MAVMGQRHEIAQVAQLHGPGKLHRELRSFLSRQPARSSAETQGMAGDDGVYRFISVGTGHPGAPLMRLLRAIPMGDCTDRVAPGIWGMRKGGISMKPVGQIVAQPRRARCRRWNCSRADAG
jgi:hypothetical protein